MIITPETDNGMLPIKGVVPVVFLAGGITGCPDWQSDLIDLIKCEGPFILANPRRVLWDMSTDSREQIAWEYAWLDRADIISFWFPCETLCPITLFELGDVGRRTMGKSDSSPSLIVGAHPKYQHLFDIQQQMSLRNPAFGVCDSLDVVASSVNQRLARWWWENS